MIRVCSPTFPPHAPAAPDWTPLYADLSPEDARTHLPDLTRLLRRHLTQALVRRFDDWAIPDADLLGYLGTLARATSDDPDATQRLLEQQLADSTQQLEEAGRLDEAATPLLPLIKRYLDSGLDWTRPRSVCRIGPLYPVRSDTGSAALRDQRALNAVQGRPVVTRPRTAAGRKTPRDGGPDARLTTPPYRQ